MTDVSDAPKANGEVRTVSTTGAAKGVKPEAFDLIPSGPLSLLARFYGTEAVDFTDSVGWEPVFNYVEDKLNMFWIGEDTDPDTGLPLLVSAAAGALHLLDTDERFTSSVERYHELEIEPYKGLNPPLRYDLIPASPLFALARHYGAGASKYAAHNWAAGYEWSKPFAALKRHLWTARNGEHIDPELQSPHLIAVAWHCLTMVEFYVTHPEFDDRPVRGTQLTVMSRRASQASE